MKKNSENSDTIRLCKFVPNGRFCSWFWISAGEKGGDGLECYDLCEMLETSPEPRCVAFDKHLKEEPIVDKLDGRGYRGCRAVRCQECVDESKPKGIIYSLDVLGSGTSNASVEVCHERDLA